jgi:hypothetical protein
MVVIEQAELNKYHKGEPFVVGVLKIRKPKLPLWFQDFLDNRFTNVENDIVNLKNDIKDINKRLDNVVRLNNLKE